MIIQAIRSVELNKRCDRLIKDQHKNSEKKNSTNAMKFNTSCGIGTYTNTGNFLLYEEQYK